MTYSVHPAARQDIDDALDFYLEHAGPAMARRFIDEFERSLKLLVHHPGIGTPTTRGRRALPMRVFPYSIVYRSLGSVIRVIVVRHHRRRPGFGGSRA